MKKIFPILAYLVTVFVSRHYCDSYWIVGPVFAAGYLLAHGKVPKGIALKEILFFAASTLVYALVYWIHRKGWNFKQDTLDMLFGALTAAVVLGSLLMPFLHSLLYGNDLGTVRKTSLYLVLSWYGSHLMAMIDDSARIPGNIDYLLISIALWQGIYFKQLKS